MKSRCADGQRVEGEERGEIGGVLYLKQGEAVEGVSEKEMGCEECDANI